MKSDINLMSGVSPPPTRRFLHRPLLMAVLALIVLALMAGIYHKLFLYRTDLAEQVAASAVQNERLLLETAPLSMMEEEIEQFDAEMAQIEALGQKEVNRSGCFESIYAVASGLADINLLHGADGERIIIEGRTPSLKALAELITSLQERPDLKDIRLENADYRIIGDRNHFGSSYPDEQTLYQFRLSCRPATEGSDSD